MVVTHIDHLALTVGQGIHEAAHIVESLLVDHLYLDIVVAEVGIVEQVYLSLIIRYGVLVAFLTKSVDNHVVGDACEPCAKLTASGVATLLEGHNGLDKGLLEEVFGHFLIAHDKIDIVEKFALIASKQLIKRLVITFCITRHQHIVGEHIVLFHYYLLLFCLA